MNYRAAFLLLLCSPALAEVKLAGVFGDHMVVQQKQAIPVFGWAEPGELVKASLGDGSLWINSKADENGRWIIKLHPMPAGGPHKLTVKGSADTVVVNDVLVGEVWLCSGQSNMAMTVSRSKDFDNEKTLADHPKIRMFKTAANSRPDKQDDCKGAWKVASADTVGSFSATAWFFGRKLHKELDVPIGLINSSWGGTDIAAWTSKEAQETDEVLAGKMVAFDKAKKNYSPERAEQQFRKSLKRWQEKKAAGEKVGRKPRKAIDPMRNQNRPSNLFNGMIHPLIPYGIRGAIWYQGERNSKSIENGQLYADQLKLLITDWRTRWGQGDFPFITVQLPNFHAKQTKPVESTGWVMVRESELRSLELKNTGIAVTTDVGMANDIHPKNKQVVGQRLALWALGTTYEKKIVYSGPLFSYQQHTLSNGEKPGKIELSFTHVGDNLSTTKGKFVTGFAIAGDDKVFHAARGNIVKGGSVVVLRSKKVPNPVAARYNWADNPNGNLVNSAGLPASPFRTDTWAVKSPTKPARGKKK